MVQQYDAVILGGGASGLLCAIEALQQHPRLRVAIVERNDRIGKKLLATGNGRCNLTNTAITKQNAARFYTGSFRRQTETVIEQFDAQQLLRYFGALGLETAADGNGRVYPISNQASSVLDVLRFSCERLGAEIFCGENIRSVKKNGKMFVVKTDNSSFSSRQLVVACGSKASPKLGGTAGGADILRNFGHKVAPFSPALCPVKVTSELLKSLKGLRAQARVSLRGRTEDGEIQFADGALSGICVFNLSLYAKKGDIITVDLLRSKSVQEAEALLYQHRKLFAELPSDNLLTGILQKRLAQAVMKTAGVRDFSKICGDLSKQELSRIAAAIKGMPFEVIENSGFEQAQCAKGGVVGAEINERTMQSKKVSNLYVCGEVVDVCGMCGGFNLHFAFASGYVAGKNIC